ncbi:MAG: 2-C-methyl-D-erythritol 2,4-cyclodiphosphate synthase [Flavobacteriales bacterium]|nr:2-C-methyl-D-erythritol 2,4-cyclodiphosphate synthase [Flavobacteriales bacterium]|tara:strand:- start:622 stop:1098 length:477 start_codon:yes stop_codon:yes gene_type:complete
MSFRVGFGFDVHQLVEGEEFWLGGILLDHYKGAVGHSDADVLIHAICDALLGAAALGDIGYHFPDTANKYKGIDSKILLKEVVQLITEKGYSIGNIDATVSLQLPKLKPHILSIREKLASVMSIDVDLISVKATTTEKLGYVGKEEGVNAHAVCLINS